MILESKFREKIEETLKLRFNKQIIEFIYENCFVAGGAVRDFIIDRRHNDIDIFFKDKNKIQEFKDLFVKYNLADFSNKWYRPYNSTHTCNFIVTNYAITIGRLQFITFRTGEPIDIVNTFDFTINQCYYDLKNNTFYIKDRASLSNKLLVVNEKTLDTKRLLSRLLYFMDYGFKPTTTTVGTIAMLQSTADYPSNYEEYLSKENEIYSATIHQSIFDKYISILNEQIKNTKLGSLL